MTSCNQYQLERFARANVGKNIKEGRHVGLDFYDLLIEALKIRQRALSPYFDDHTSELPAIPHESPR